MSRNERPTFSIVVAVRNAASVVAGCLDSVLAQTLRDWELLVIDGGSTDGTQSVVERYAGFIAYRESKRDRGIAHAWNKALAHTRGEWILFLGADDRLAHPRILEQAREALADGRQPRVVYGTVTLLDDEGRAAASAGMPWEEARRDLLRRNTLPHQGVFHHRSLFDRHGGFDESFRILADYELLLRELKSEAARFVPDLVVVEMGAGGVSQQRANHYRATRELLEAQRKNGLSSLPYWARPRFLRSTVFEVLRRVLGWESARRVADAYERLMQAVRPRSA